MYDAIYNNKLFSMDQIILDYKDQVGDILQIDKHLEELDNLSYQLEFRNILPFYWIRGALEGEEIKSFDKILGRKADLRYVDFIKRRHWRQILAEEKLETEQLKFYLLDSKKIFEKILKIYEVSNLTELLRYKYDEECIIPIGNTLIGSSLISRSFLALNIDEYSECCSVGDWVPTLRELDDLIVRVYDNNFFEEALNNKIS